MDNLSYDYIVDAPCFAKKLVQAINAKCLADPKKNITIIVMDKEGTAIEIKLIDGAYWEVVETTNVDEDAEARREQEARYKEQERLDHVALHCEID